MTEAPLPFRVGRHNERNIYKVAVDSDDRHDDQHIGCMFTPEDGLLAVAALNFTYGPAVDANNPLPEEPLGGGA